DELRNRIYVSNYLSGDVWVYDANSLNVLKVIPVGPGATLMRILPAIDAVAVVVRGPNGVAIIENMNMLAVLGTTGAGAFGLAADPDHNFFIVINRDASNGRVI
ncbi:hypothetical protein V6O07_07395, partial [Arthrospira platensis SPKY2]